MSSPSGVQAHGIVVVYGTFLKLSVAKYHFNFILKTFPKCVP